MNFRLTVIVIITLVFGTVVMAHPIPDIPVRAFFYGSGKARIEVEIDPRCFLEDPNEELYMLYWYFQRCDEAEKQKMIDDAIAFVPTRLKFAFESSQGVRKPKYEVDFTTHDGRPLEKLDDPVVMRLVWETVLPKTAKTYQIQTKKVGILSVIPLNHVNNEAVEKVQVLFPGEDSYVLDLPERLSEEEIRSVMTKPLIFGVGLLIAFIFLRTFRRFSK
ncbi:MAG: hypothetical protein ACKVJU_04430 [Verrucomicrobiales bacterium]